MISEQSKPPDFLLEVAPEGTGEIDVVEKREGFAALGIPENWLFDETGEHYQTMLAGDVLLEGRDEPIAIETLAGGALQRYDGRST